MQRSLWNCLLHPMLCSLNIQSPANINNVSARSALLRSNDLLYSIAKTFQKHFSKLNSPGLLEMWVLCAASEDEESVHSISVASSSLRNLWHLLMRTLTASVKRTSGAKMPVDSTVTVWEEGQNKHIYFNYITLKPYNFLWTNNMWKKFCQKTTFCVFFFFWP